MSSWPRPAPMGLNFQTHVYESSGMSNPDLWAQGTTFGRDRPLRRQVQLRYRPCPADRSLAQGCLDGPKNERSARRPTRQPGGRSWASADRVWRRYTPHKTRKITLKMAFGTTGPHHADLLRWVRIAAHVFTTLLAARAASGDSGWGRYTLVTQAS